MQHSNVPPPSTPDKRDDEQPKRKALFLEFYGRYEPYAEILDLDTLSDAELRETVADWLKPGEGGPSCRFIVKCENIGLQLVGLPDGFEVRDAETGEVLHAVPTPKPACMKKPPGSRPKVRVGKNLSPLAKGHP